MLPLLGKKWARRGRQPVAHISGDIRLSVQPYVCSLIPREKEWDCLWDMRFGDFRAIDAQDRRAAGARLGRIGNELLHDGMLSSDHWNCSAARDLGN